MRLTVGFRMLIAMSAMAMVTPGEADAATGDLWSLKGTNVNVRSSPGTYGDVVATINPGETLIELNKINDWYLMNMPDRNQQGWVYGPLLGEAASTAALSDPTPSFDTFGTEAPRPAPAAPKAQAASPRQTEPAYRTASLDQGVQGGDPRKGEEVFYKCGSCHTTVAGIHAAGPSLVGVFGSRPASSGGYGYSEGMRAFAADGHVWDAATLDHFIRRPARVVKGTSMPFSGIRDDNDRRDLIAYLQQISR